MNAADYDLEIKLVIAKRAMDEAYMLPDQAHRMRATEHYYSLCDIRDALKK
jgi:hypothetical protein